MLSDEITTGSVRTTDAEKRDFASKSHQWNIKNPKFKTIFPEYCDTEMKKLPNMGEQDLGKPDGPPLPSNLGNPDGSTASGHNAVASASNSVNGAAAATSS